MKLSIKNIIVLIAAGLFVFGGVFWYFYSKKVDTKQNSTVQSESLQQKNFTEEQKKQLEEVKQVGHDASLYALINRIQMGIYFYFEQNKNDLIIKNLYPNFAKVT